MHSMVDLKIFHVYTWQVLELNPGNFPVLVNFRESPVKKAGELPWERGMKMGNIWGIPRFLENRGIPWKIVGTCSRGICNKAPDGQLSTCFSLSIDTSSFSLQTY